MIAVYLWYIEFREYIYIDERSFYEYILPIKFVITKTLSVKTLPSKSSIDNFNVKKFTSLYFKPQYYS